MGTQPHIVRDDREERAPALSPFHAAVRRPHAERLPVTTHTQLVAALTGLQETLGTFAQAVDALADTSGSPGAGPQHRLKDMTDSETDAYDRGYRAGYTRAWRKGRAYEKGIRS